MKRIAIAFLVAATAGVASWWASQRTSALRGSAVNFQTGQPSSPFPQTGAQLIDPDMVITPRRDPDPEMVKILPNPDPKMFVVPAYPRRNGHPTPGDL